VHPGGTTARAGFSSAALPRLHNDAPVGLNGSRELRSKFVHPGCTTTAGEPIERAIVWFGRCFHSRGSLAKGERAVTHDR
jgi:hypothetical protein